MDNLSSLAGLIASDGHLDKSYHGIRFITADQGMLKQFLQLTSNYKKKIWKSRSGFGSKRYLVYIYDKNLKAILNKRYKIPLGKKSSKLIIPKNLPLKEKFNFLKGLFSGDGSISFDNKKGKRYMQIIFWTKSKKLANQINTIFKKTGIISGLNYSKLKDQCRLTIRNHDSLIKFKNLIGFIHPRKQKLLGVLS